MSTPSDSITFAKQPCTSDSDTVSADPLQIAAPSIAAASPVEREAAKIPDRCRPEFLPMLQTLVATYKENRKRTRPEHRLQGKQIHSLIQGYDGIKAECYKCSQIIDDIRHAEVHHINGNPYDNRISNTPPVHGLCNRELNGKKGGEINRQRAAAYRSQFHIVTPAYVRENIASAHMHTGADGDAYAGVQWTSKEGKKHDKMRSKWDALLWTMFDANTPEAMVTKKHLANYARSADFVGEGTSTTFYKMIAEDIACNVLEEGHDEDGNEAVKIIWPMQEERRKIEELAHAHLLGTITERDVIDAIKVMKAPRKEIRPQLNYFRWFMHRQVKSNNGS